MKTFNYKKSFLLESGKLLPGITVAYHTYGKLNANKDNCIWVCHALTADSDVAKWWPGTVSTEGFLDPEKYFIVCANILGSCYGTTGPSSLNPATGELWLDEFPDITIRDMVHAHILLADHLGINKIISVVGSSLGGFQALEWKLTQPAKIKSLVLIATGPVATPWAIALDEAQRMAIKADKTYERKDLNDAKKGLAAARAIAMLSYRGASGYNLTQQDNSEDNDKIHFMHRAASYQQHQGKKLANRFDVFSYMTILNAFDSHNITRGRGNCKELLSQIKSPVLTIGITTDILFPPSEMRSFSELMPNSFYNEIKSEFGHDGFLVETDKLNNLIKNFLLKI